MAEIMLELTGVATDIAQYHILHGVDLAVPRGQPPPCQTPSWRGARLR